MTQKVLTTSWSSLCRYRSCCGKATSFAMAHNGRAIPPPASGAASGMSSGHMMSHRAIARASQEACLGNSGLNVGPEAAKLPQFNLFEMLGVSARTAEPVSFGLCAASVDRQTKWSVEGLPEIALTARHRKCVCGRLW